jgi:pre-mRNA-splicing helicase BRR2
MWGDRESPLRQLPYFDADRIQKAKQAGVETIFDFMEIEDESVRDGILAGLGQPQIAEVANVVNRYPNIDLSFALEAEEGDADSADNAAEEKCVTVKTNESVLVNIALQREDEGDEDDEPTPVGPVSAPFFPTPKDEGWWLVVGEPETKSLVSIKRLTLQQAYKCRLDFAAPEQPGTYRYKLYLMCDAWVGCDQEYEFVVRVEQGMDVDGSDEDQ